MPGQVSGECGSLLGIFPCFPRVIRELACSGLSLALVRKSTAPRGKAHRE